jgi:hypothetical protein
MPEVQASYDPGADISVQASAILTGGRGVGLPSSRNAGGPAGISDLSDGLLVAGLPTAGGAIFGVASHDAAIGGRVNVMRPPKVVPMECSAAVAISAELMVGADGRVATRTAGNTVIGRALSVTSAAGQFCQVELFLNGLLTLT